MMKTMMMKHLGECNRWLAAALLLTIHFSLFAPALQAQVHVRVRTAWYAQAQFAGLYVAIEKGFFREAGLEVEIQPVVGNRPSLDARNVASTDFLMDHLTNTLIYNDTTHGPRLQQLLQSSQHTSVAIVSRRPLRRPSDLEGLTVGTWHQGRSELAICYALENGVKNVRWVPMQNFHNAAFLSGAVDAQLVMVYNELYQLELSGRRVAPENILCLKDTPLDLPADGFYVRADYAEAHPEVTRAMRDAVRRGWEWLAQPENREEGIEIVLQRTNLENTRTNLPVQRYMLDKVLELQLLNGQRPYRLSQAQFDKAVALLSRCGFLHNPHNFNDFVY